MAPVDPTRSNQRSEYVIGVFFLVASAVTYSTAGLFTKGVDAAAWAVIFWRGVFAALPTTAWVIARGSFQRDFFGMGWAGLAVGVVGAAGTAAFIPAFKLTSIANVALIYAVAPLIAALLAWVAIGERIGRATLWGAIGALGGVGIIVMGSVGNTSLAGDSLALVMTLAMATIMVIYRARPETPSAGPAVLQSLLLMPVALAFGAPLQTSLAEIAILAAFGVLFALASVTLAEGAKRVPAGQSALIGALETPLAPLLAFLILAEIPPMATLLGGAVVLGAVVASIQRKPAT